MKKKLIVSGCSFTDKEFVSAFSPEIDCSFPKWPEILADKLDMEVVNLAFCGAGNEYIYSTLLDGIMNTPKEEIGLVLAAWSQAQREDYQKYVKNASGQFSYDDKFNKKMRWHNIRHNRQGDIFYWMIDTLRKYISFQQLCKSYNIPYRQFQMIPAFEGYLHGLMKLDQEIFDNLDNQDFNAKYEYKPILRDRDEDKKKILELYLRYQEYIDEECFIGWPPTKVLGGHCIEHATMHSRKIDAVYPDLVVSPHDMHPNKKGHEKIAEYLYTKITLRNLNGQLV